MNTVNHSASQPTIHSTTHVRELVKEYIEQLDPEHARGRYMWTNKNKTHRTVKFVLPKTVPNWNHETRIPLDHEQVLCDMEMKFEHLGYYTRRTYNNHGLIVRVYDMVNKIEIDQPDLFDSSSELGTYTFNVKTTLDIQS